jgi:hypothetical protein
MSQASPFRPVQALFAITVFLSAALLFQVQPLMSKLILPWFGGSPSVWTVCLLFFQGLLFLGYLLAHSVIVWLSPRGQWRLQTGLLVIAMLSPILPSEAWKPIAEGNQTLQILGLLTWHIGLPYLLLCATGPLVQAWFSRACPGASPYWLYALSNLGSLLGLLAYPFVVDVWFSSQQQVQLWYGAFALYVVLVVTCGWRASRTATGPEQPRVDTVAATTRASRAEIGLWFVLSMLPSLLLSAVTTKLSVDVSPIPFLWVAPLTLYLVSLIVCFSKEAWAGRWLWGFVTAILLAGSGYLIGQQQGMASYGSLPLEFAVHLGTFFAICMVCHGEMVRLKPQTPASGDGFGGALTEFYLVTAAGGAAGGLFVAVIAPALFSMFLEHHLGLVLAATLPPLVWIGTSSKGWRDRSHRAIWLGMILTLVPLGIGIYRDVSATLRNVHMISRNFYGVIRVVERGQGHPNGSFFEEVHGGTRHGLQMLRPDLARLPTTYYGLTSGVARELQAHHADRPRRIGVIGLGVGTLATYGRPGDVIDFYEIDSTVLELARDFFRYVADSEADVTLIPGDARLSLEHESPKNYDILVLDAFSSDAVPIHLLTSEAFDVYRRHLAPDGVIAAHISSQYFHLSPVLAAQAERLKWRAVQITDRLARKEQLVLPSRWVLMSAAPSAIEKVAQSNGATSELGKPLLWTDSRHNLLEILVW